MKNANLSIALVVCFSGLDASGQTARPQYRRTTVESMLKSASRIDGARVELSGNIASGFETSVFWDASTCKGLGLVNCSVWLSIGDCTVVGNRYPEQPCGQVLEHLYRENQFELDSRTSLTIRHVIVRGIASTVRKDIKWDKSVPKSARIGGFGHLGAYPAQIIAEQMELEENRVNSPKP